MASETKESELRMYFVPNKTNYPVLCEERTSSFLLGHYQGFIIHIFNKTEKPKSLSVQWGPHLMYQDFVLRPLARNTIRPPNMVNGKFMLYPSEDGYS